MSLFLTPLKNGNNSINIQKKMGTSLLKLRLNVEYKYAG